MSNSAPTSSAERRSAFTLVELLLALSVGLVVIAIAGPLLTTTLRVKAREDQWLALQQNVRAAAELIAMELRETDPSRINYAGSPLTAHLGTAATSDTRLVLTVLNPDATFRVARPNGYPANASYPVRATTPIESPNDAGTTCQTIFGGNDLAYVYTPRGTDGTLIVTHDRNACISDNGQTKLNHRQTTTELHWSPLLRVTRADIVTYAVSPGANDAPPALLRTTYGGRSSIVAHGVTDLSISYLQSDGTPLQQPDAPPAAVRFTVTGRAPGPLHRTQPAPEYRVEQTVKLRQTSACENCEDQR